MILLAVIRCKKYAISYWKAILSMILSVFIGTFSGYLMFFVENGVWGGQSFFGIILFAPIMLMLVAMLMKISVGKYLSFFAPIIAFVLVIMKYRCIYEGCCGGNDFFNSISPWPLQLIEAIASLAIVFALLFLENKEENRSDLYAYYLVIYGCVRLVLNSFRANLTPFVIVPAGHFWSIISLCIGCAYFLLIKKVNR